MATKSYIQAVWNADTYAAYKLGVDYTDDGDGTITPVGGSELADAVSGGDTIKVQVGSYSDVAPAGPYLHIIDTSVCGVRYLAARDTAFGSGTALDVHATSLRIIERILSLGTIKFTIWASDAAAQSMQLGGFVAVRLALKDKGTGSQRAYQEWRGQVTKIDPITSPSAKRMYSVTAHDYRVAMRDADVTAVPEQVRAYTEVYPGDTGLPNQPQTGVAGVQAYYLTDLLDTVIPTGCTYTLNAPDVLIERLPANTDGLEMVASVMRAAGYYSHWEAPANLVISQHENVLTIADAVVTDSITFEAKREIGEVQRAVDSVVIQRPDTVRERIVDAAPPAKDEAPRGDTGAKVMPERTDTEASAGAGNTVIYRVRENWAPSEPYTTYEPGAIMFAFGDQKYNISGYTSHELYRFLRFQPGQVIIEPPTKWTQKQQDGYNGRDYYFYIDPVYVKIQASNLNYVDGYVVSRHGYYTAAGAVSRNQTPIGGATVTLVGQSTGVILGPATTNNAGYYRMDTGGVRDKWLPHVYLDDDSYLANVNSLHTTGHPYDDDPDNDALGPDNRTVQDELWYVSAVEINFTVTYRTGRTADAERADAQSDHEDYQAYVGYGGYEWGSTDPNATEIISPYDLEIDTANVTNTQQAQLLGEKVLDINAEAESVYVVTKPFGGLATQAGRVMQIDIAADGGMEARARILTREITVADDAFIIEVCSTSDDMFAAEIDKQYARIGRVETAASKLRQDIDVLHRLVRTLEGVALNTNQLGSGL